MLALRGVDPDAVTGARRCRATSPACSTGPSSTPPSTMSRCEHWAADSGAAPSRCSPRTARSRWPPTVPGLLRPGERRAQCGSCFNGTAAMAASHRCTARRRPPPPRTWDRLRPLVGGPARAWRLRDARRSRQCGGPACWISSPNSWKPTSTAAATRLQPGFRPLRPFEVEAVS